MRKVKVLAKSAEEDLKELPIRFGDDAEIPLIGDTLQVITFAESGGGARVYEVIGRLHATEQREDTADHDAQSVHTWSELVLVVMERQEST